MNMDECSKSVSILGEVPSGQSQFLSLSKQQGKWSKIPFVVLIKMDHFDYTLWGELGYEN